MSEAANALRDWLDEFGQTKRDRLLNGFYSIKDKTGKKVPFRMNEAQADFFDNRHGLDTILKARQLGFTTVIQLDGLDDCLFTPNYSFGVIAQTLDAAQNFFDDKLKFAYDGLPTEFRQVVTSKTDNKREMKFSNGSRVVVGTSLRSGTYQKLHISEFGKICAKTPDKAKEIVTGAFNTVEAGQSITVESTAEGQSGYFYQMSTDAQAKRISGAELTPLDFKFHFYPWYEDKKYTLDYDVPMPSKLQAQFIGYEVKGIDLTPGQKAWYIKKWETQREEMKREYPTTPEEAFEAAIEGAYYHHELRVLRERNQIRTVDFNPKYPVSTFWDIGVNDKTAIWFYQNINGRHVFIDYRENAHRGVDFYAALLRTLHEENGYCYDTIYLPHDGGNMSWSTGEERDSTLRRLSGVPVVVVPRVANINIGIQAVRNVLPSCHIDEADCFIGLSHLQAYRKEYDEKRGAWKNKPFHGDESNGADAFRTFAEANSRNMIQSSPDYSEWGDDYDDEDNSDHKSEYGGY